MKNKFGINRERILDKFLTDFPPRSGYVFIVRRDGDWDDFVLGVYIHLYDASGSGISAVGGSGRHTGSFLLIELFVMSGCCSASVVVR